MTGINFICGFMHLFYTNYKAMMEVYVYESVYLLCIQAFTYNQTVVQCICRFLTYIAPVYRLFWKQLYDHVKVAYV